MTEKDILDIALKAPTVIFAIIGAYWSAVRFLKRDELFPRIGFEVSANFLGLQKEQVITEVVAILENKGDVPIKIKSFAFKVRALSSDDDVIRGGREIRNQIVFPKIVEDGRFIPEAWDNSFIYPGVKTEYNFVTAIPGNISFVRVEGHFDYGSRGRSHHAAKILSIPAFASRACNIGGNGHT